MDHPQILTAKMPADADHPHIRIPRMWISCGSKYSESEHLRFAVVRNNTRGILFYELKLIMSHRKRVYVCMCVCVCVSVFL